LKKEEKMIQDTVKTTEEIILDTNGTVSDVERIPVVEPNPLNPDGVIVTDEPVDTDSIPTPADQTTPADKEQPTQGQQERIGQINKRRNDIDKV